MKIFDPEFTGSIQFLTEVQGGFTGSLFGTSSWAENVSTASYVQTAQTASYFTASNLTGDIRLGVQTSGDYVSTITQGTGVTVTGGTGEGSTTNISIGQSVSTTSNVQFNQITSSIISSSNGITGSLFGTSSFARNVSNLVQDVYITGSLFIKDNLKVFGTSSIQYVTSSQLDISTNIITVNTEANTLRFGGLSVIDSGSSPKQSGSILYDSVQDEWIFVHRASSTAAITSSHFLVGPETYNNVGNETYITQHQLLRSNGNEHVTGSRISDDGTTITLAGDTNITSHTKITGSFIVSASSNTVEVTIIGESQISGAMFVTASTSTNAINSVGNIITTGSLFISASGGNNRVISAIGNTVITGSLIVSGSGGAGVFSKGGNYVDLVNGVPAFTSSLYVWRAPFPCQVISLYANKSGSSNVNVNARRKSGASFALHTGSNLVLTTNDSWTAANSVQNTAYAIGDSLEFVITGSFLQCAIQVDFIKTN
jgi:hypothetical protein